MKLSDFDHDKLRALAKGHEVRAAATVDNKYVVKRLSVIFEGAVIIAFEKLPRSKFYTCVVDKFEQLRLTVDKYSGGTPRPNKFKGEDLQHWCGVAVRAARTEAEIEAEEQAQA